MGRRWYAAAVGAARKASAVNCAVLPEERTMKLSNLKVLSIQNLRGIDTNGEDLR